MVRFVDYKQIRNRIGMHSGQNTAKLFTCVRYLTGLEKLLGPWGCPLECRST